MRPSIVSQLAPSGYAAGDLALEPFRSEGDHVVEGVLRARDGRWFPVIDGVPSFLTGVLQQDLSDFAERHKLPYQVTTARAAAAEQAKTNETFSDKWRRFKSYGLEPEHEDFLFGWYCKKFGLAGRDELKAFHGKRRRILECGPGSGFNTKFMAENCPGEVFALDISAAAFTTFGNTRQLPNCSVVQADLMEAPFPDAYFDFIIADGVLHHTPDTRLAVEALYRKLEPGGQFFFYVYKKMGAARVFCDAHVRENFMPLSPDECYAACEGITELGRELSRLNAKITLEKPIPVLGIPAGTHDVQRLIYYNFLKCFWNEAFDYETNNMVNFDWYHPHNAWQHSQEEVEGWLRDLGAKEWQVNDANPNGISVLVTKPA
ncbi:bifunctional 2-polyprenyl-6-hydroxyphenol methylase/3-demethylubiquinol 3-O-methyltransferase UbiG [Bosea sp. (in: a-proteobacteria)]|uniref:class I SAM-dependent methyltransferase n=1 Tax=Bosea sp. (in: a-proteobacteria) TaxID=1871050 RepID=UPI00262354BE|nr:class I SAM-dependent methyltransferase [Bosea sp. (in: a-proteobacteria)]MCO5090669.1 methyltransferase domain-containing protein [Bosea sp. (in: a-proteobacteria)]